jgi:hypothetical protein
MQAGTLAYRAAMVRRQLSTQIVQATGRNGGRADIKAQG